MKPTLWLRHSASALSASWATSVPATMTWPEVGPVDAGDQVQERRLARARRPHERDELALGDLQAQPVEHGELLAVALVDLAHVAHVHHRPLRAAFVLADLVVLMA